MLKNNLYRTLISGGIAAGFGLAVLGMGTGCDQLKAEHAKMVKPEKEQWDRTRLQLMYGVAEQQYRVGDLDKCRESIKEALTVNAPFAPIHVLAARVDLEGGSLEDAADHLKKAIDINGNDPEAYFLMGVVYQRWQKLDLACDYYEKAVQHKSSDATYVLAVVEMKISLGQLDEARQILDDKMLYFEQSPGMRIALAKIATLKGDHATAVKHFRDATLLLPEDKNIRWSYAQALFDAGKYRDAVPILEDMRLDPPTLPKSHDLLTKGNDPAADEAEAKSVKTGLLTMLGESYLALQRPTDARACFQELIRIAPESTSAYLALGRTCLVTNELTLSLASVKKVLRLDPKNVPAMILQAVVQQKQKKWSDALETLTPAAALAPKDSTILCMQGISKLQLGKQDEAALYFERAVVANPNDTWASQLLGQVKPVKPPVESQLGTAPTEAGPVGDAAVTTATPTAIPDIEAP